MSGGKEPAPQDGTEAERSKDPEPPSKGGPADVAMGGNGKDGNGNGDNGNGDNGNGDNGNGDNGNGDNGNEVPEAYDPERTGDLTPEQVARVRAMPGGEDWYADQATYSPERRAVGVDEARIALDAENRGEEVEYLNKVVPRSDGKGDLTEIDVETTNEVIQVKGGDYMTPKKLRKKDVNQWRATKMYNEQMRFDDNGAKLPPKKLVFHFTGGASDTIKAWCRERGIEPREGRP